MTTLAAASQVAGTTLQEANAVVTVAVPQSQPAPGVLVASPSPAAIRTTALDRVRSVDLRDVPKTPGTKRPESQSVSDATGTPKAFG